MRDPTEIVQPGQKITVRVMSVDFDTNKISLTMRDANEPAREQREPREQRDPSASGDRFGSGGAAGGRGGRERLGKIATRGVPQSPPVPPPTLKSESQTLTFSAYSPFWHGREKFSICAPERLARTAPLGPVAVHTMINAFLSSIWYGILLERRALSGLQVHPPPISDLIPFSYGGTALRLAMNPDLRHDKFLGLVHSKRGAG